MQKSLQEMDKERKPQQGKTSSLESPEHNGTLHSVEADSENAEN